MPGMATSMLGLDDRYIMTMDLNSGWNMAGLRTTQMYLIVAEAEIHKGNYAEAMDALVAVNPASNKAKEAYAMIDQVAAKMSEAERAAREAELARLEQEREASQRAFDNQMMLEKMRLEASSKAAESARSAAAEVSLSGINAWLFGKLK